MQTIEAAAREHGVDAERMRNRAYYTYRRASRSTIRSLPRIEPASFRGRVKNPTKEIETPASIRGNTVRVYLYIQVSIIINH